MTRKNVRVEGHKVAGRIAAATIKLIEPVTHLLLVALR